MVFMANKKKTKGKKTRRPTKVEIERQRAIQRMITALVLTIILFFGIIRLGIFGITVYNVIRFMVGSLAYLFIAATLIYLYFFKWLRKKDGLVAGF